MDEDTRAEHEAVEQPEPMPSSKQQATESEEVEDVESAEPESEISEEEELSLPEDASDRTRAEFEKLKESNKKLKEELDGRRKTESVFESLRVPNQPKQADYVDPQTGQVDVSAFNQAVQRAEAAYERIVRYEEQRQEEEAYGEYPGLDPNSDEYNSSLYSKTRAILIDSQLYPQDYGITKPMTLLQAAKIAAGEESKVVAKAKEAGAKEALEKLTPKEQASLEATGRSDRRKQTSATPEELSVRTRYGDKLAVVERLKNIPPAQGYQARSDQS